MKERKRKAMLVMPVIIVPFIVFIFWVLGLVGPAEAVAAGRSAARGININLPAAIPGSDSSWDKLRFYEQADKDSAKLRQLRRQDPYLNEEKFEHDPLKKYGAKARYQPYPDGALNEADEEEKKVYQKIGEIHRQLERKPAPKKTKRTDRTVDINQHKDVDRLEHMMTLIHDREQEEDPEMVQIKELMESIKDIQHPERLSERLQQPAIKPKVFEVKSSPSSEGIASASVQGNRFYSIDQPAAGIVAHDMAAVVHEEQLIATGDLVKMRLLQNIFVNDAQLAENSFVYGAAKMNGNRMLVHVSFVQVQGQHYPVSLEVIGHDGLPGIPVHASSAAIAAGQTADRTTQGVSIMSVDHSLGAQVAGAAIQTGKKLLKRQTKLVRYTIPAGYEVQLSNNNH